MNQILESIKPVIKKSSQVKINKDKIKGFCEKFNFNDIKYWMDASPFDLSNLKDHKKLNFIFVFNSVNFCYWGDPKWSIKYQGKRYDGAWGMMASLSKAIDNKIPILEPIYLANISKEDLEKIWEGNVRIPLFEERWQILKENGSVLTQKYKENFGNVIKSANEDAIKLLKIVVADFPSFNDFSIYDDQKVFFHKRAQLLISDIYRAFKAKGYGNLKNTKQLTAFSDYKIPQVLRKLGILEYFQELTTKVDNRILIPKDSKEEIEIRANTIWAIELIKNELKTKIPEITAMDIDSYLWLLGQNKLPNAKPYHLTRT
ncbi:MAG: queuosine salvage family protein, partial [Nanoarchaeota archaeon]|nr:queuosine salvage family protein [Nanoarchaeota archaeon]